MMCAAIRFHSLGALREGHEGMAQHGIYRVLTFSELESSFLA